MPEACWPVRDGQTGVVAGDQTSGNNQEESQRGNKNGKAMLGGVIRGRGQNCSLRVLNILALPEILIAAREPYGHNCLHEKDESLRISPECCARKASGFACFVPHNSDPSLRLRMLERTLLCR
jgi:hypothetical protein